MNLSMQSIKITVSYSENIEFAKIRLFLYAIYHKVSQHSLKFKLENRDNNYDNSIRGIKIKEINFKSRIKIMGLISYAGSVFYYYLLQG